MVATRRLDRLRSDILERTRLPDGPMVVALSGGADSAALLSVASLEGRDVRALHVDHRQPHSPRASTAAVETARVLGVHLDVIGVEVAGGSGFEHRARAARYAALSAAAQPSDWILTGHTLDDLAETVLMRLARGSGLDGLSGIPETRPPYRRPFLRVRRSETRELCALSGLPFFDDPSNADERFLRNRVRRRLIPTLVSTFGSDPSVKLGASALELQREREFLDRFAAAVEVQVEVGEVSVDVAALEAAEPVVVSRVVRRMWMLLGFEHPLEAQPVERVLSVLTGASRSAQLGRSAVADIRGGRLRIRIEHLEAVEVEITPGLRQLQRYSPQSFSPQSFSLGSFQVAAILEDGPIEFPVSAWQMAVPRERLRTRLTMRWARPDDEIGAIGIMDLLDEAGVGDRDAWPVVEMGGEVVWVPGVRRIGWESGGETGYLSLVASEESVWGTSTR